MLDGDRFVRREELAPGVWLAYDERLGRPVVLKRAAAGEPRAQARLNHPHVVTVYEHVEGWAVLEYAPGGSLAGRVLPLHEAARIGAQIADALAYMHGKGLVHCDVKPGNIVLAENGVAKLTDFGSAYRVDPEATVTPVARLSYTDGFAAPELVRGSPVPASDVYSLAITMRTLAPELSSGLEDLLSANSRDRPSAAEACRLFQAIADGMATTVTGAGGPAQLPADVYGFAGRAAELEQLSRVSAPVVVISGTAGVGKTTLAVHWAHHIAGRFPDGQLYVNLRGFDPSGQVVDPADAIRGYLDALGLAPERIPADLDAQAALYRSTLSTKRMLIVLDNARDTDQVRPLLPGTPGCQVIVTSRNDLIGLVTKEGARPLTLDVLTDTEARLLLDHRLGADRTSAEPDAVLQIIRSCARLPLALAIVAARAATRPDFPLAAISLAGDDPETDIRAVFSWSYEQLSPDAQRLFRLLGLHPGPDISAPAAASLFGSERPPLAELTRAHLIDEQAPGRYTFHDLLHAYATELADAEPGRQAATHRMLDHYLHSAYAADKLLHPTRQPIEFAPLQDGVAPEQPTGYDEAMAWLIVEHDVLLAVLRRAAGTGFETHAWQQAWALHTYLHRRNLWWDYADMWRVALAAARRLGDGPKQTAAHRSLGNACGRLEQFDEAHVHLRAALELGTERGDRFSMAQTHLTLGYVFGLQRMHTEAIEHDRQAAELHREIGNRSGLASALNAVGWQHAQRGEYEAAVVNCDEALDLFRELRHRDGEAVTWDSLGYAHHQLGRHDLAASCHQHALDLSRELGDRTYEAYALAHLGDAQAALGDLRTAHASWRGALAILEELDHPEAEDLRGKLERGAPSR